MTEKILSFTGKKSLQDSHQPGFSQGFLGVLFIKNMIDYKKRRKRANQFQKMLLHKPTFAELKFKDILDEIKNDNIKCNYEFQRKIFGKEKFYIADFYIWKEKIVFEIDGGVHNDRFENDKEREIDILENASVRLLVRFPNEYVLNNSNEVKQNVIDILNRKGDFYQGLINRKAKMLNDHNKDRSISKGKKACLRNLLKNKEHVLSRLNDEQRSIVSLYLGDRKIKALTIEEISQKTLLPEYKIEKILGKLYWLLKND